MSFKRNTFQITHILYIWYTAKGHRLQSVCSESAVNKAIHRRELTQHALTTYTLDVHLQESSLLEWLIQVTVMTKANGCEVAISAQHHRCYNIQHDKSWEVTWLGSHSNINNFIQYTQIRYKLCHTVYLDVHAGTPSSLRGEPVAKKQQHGETTRYFVIDAGHVAVSRRNTANIHSDL